ncbi:phosphatase PAP2 family protein [Niveibacterium sp. SC-1]|uniref:phosphatase PAP2 family protein n=1 Tax=Niveibacterium sp. SC-1 TaxID=3135646 RepID=UPI00311D3CFD
MPPEHSSSALAPRAAWSRADQLLRWLPPLLLTALAIWMARAGHNQPVFLGMNAAAQSVPDGVWSAVTIMGTGACSYALLAPTLLRMPRLMAAALFTGLFAGIFTHAIKPILRMPRPAGVLSPDQIHVIGEVLRSNSFPSGHSVTAFAFAAMLIFFSRRPLLVAAIALPLAALVAFSRIAVGAHWPLDTLAGAAGGWISGMAGEWCSRRWSVWTRKPWRLFFAIAMIGLGIGLIGNDLGYPQAVWLQYLLAALAILGGLYAFAQTLRLRSAA